MQDQKSQVLWSFILLIAILIIGMVGYRVIEEMPWIDALYMTVISVSTVGFGEVKPLSFTGKLFTTGLIVMSLGAFAFIVTNLTRYFFENILSNRFKIKKVKKKIDRLKGHVIVCGYGRNGQQSVLELAGHRKDFVILESDPERIEVLENQDYLFLEGDATNEEILLEAGLERAEALITTLPNDADNLLVVITARQFNPNLKIISRASEPASELKLKRAGATNVIMSDRIGGQRMAKLVVQPDIVEFLEHIMLQGADEETIVEISCDRISSEFQRKSIRELGVRNVSGANILGLKKKGMYVLNPDPDTIVEQEDQIFALGNPGQIEKLRKILYTGSLKG